MQVAPLAAALLFLAPRGAVAEPPGVASGRVEGCAADEPLAGSCSDGRIHGAALRRALALEEAGRPSQALAALEGLEPALPDVLDRIWFLRGRALEALGRTADAILAYAQVPDGSLQAQQARLARARLLARIGQASEAVESLLPLLGPPPPPVPGRPDPAAAALLAAGRIRAAAVPPDPPGARGAFLECWAGHPLAWESRLCLAGLLALPGRHGSRPDAGAAARRAGLLLDAGRVPGAAAQLRPYLRDLPPAAPRQPAACRGRIAFGRVALLQHRPARAVAILRPLVERCAEGPLRADALQSLGDALAARGRRDEALAAYQRLALEQAGSPLAAQALFSSAELLAGSGRLADAAAAYADAAREATGSDLAFEAIFRAAWIARKLGDTAGAIGWLEGMEARARGLSSYDEARAAYWRARLLATRDEEGREEARTIWTALAARFPAEYYGLAARDRLAELRLPSTGSASADPPAQDAEPPVPPPGGNDLGDLGRDPHFRAGVSLLASGLPGAAAQELRAVDPARLNGPGGEPALAVAGLLVRAGARGSAALLLRDGGIGALRGPPSARDLGLWRLAYPGSYRAEVTRWARKAGVPADLLHALIREESGLRPQALSPAGAVGLSQLMLPTARLMAHQLGLGRPSPAELRVPSLSIRLGSRYLGSLVHRFDGSFALALAAYNAGPGAVRRWLSQRDPGQVDEFVEEIPFPETAAFVKRVLRSFAAYRLLYGSTSGEEALAQPIHDR
jgi:soluble lytic murein transglycosylase